MSDDIMDDAPGVESTKKVSILNGADASEIAKLGQAKRTFTTPWPHVRDLLSNNVAMLRTVAKVVDEGTAGLDNLMSICAVMANDKTIKNRVEIGEWTQQAVADAVRKFLRESNRLFAEKNGHTEFPVITATGKVTVRAIPLLTQQARLDE